MGSSDPMLSAHISPESGPAEPELFGSQPPQVADKENMQGAVRKRRVRCPLGVRLLDGAKTRGVVADPIQVRVECHGAAVKRGRPFHLIDLFIGLGSRMPSPYSQVMPVLSLI